MNQLIILDRTTNEIHRFDPRITTVELSHELRITFNQAKALKKNTVNSRKYLVLTRDLIDAIGPLYNELQGNRNEN